MRVLLQRVTSASVRVDDRISGEIGDGYLLLVGIQASDDDAVLASMAEKIVNLRLFEDDAGKMNLSLLDRLAGNEDVGVLVVSQFTLYGDTRKGRRPSFTNAAGPEIARPLCDAFAAKFAALGVPVASGEFGAHMVVSLVNDGPVTLWLDSDDLQRPRRGGSAE